MVRCGKEKLRCLVDFSVGSVGPASVGPGSVDPGSVDRASVARVLAAVLAAAGVNPAGVTVDLAAQVSAAVSVLAAGTFSNVPRS